MNEKPFGYVLVGRVVSDTTPHIPLRTHVIIDKDGEDLFRDIVSASCAMRDLPLQELCGEVNLVAGEVLSIHVHEVIVNPTPGPRIMEIRK